MATAAAPAGPAAGGRGWRIARADIGMLPFLASLPFIYVPKLLEGDTQPWVLLTAIVALLTYRPRSFMQRADIAVLALVAAALVAYAARAGLSLATVRVAYILLMFLVLWVLARRGGEDLFAAGVRLTLIVWFVVGLYQYLALLLGLPVGFAGRFVEGRSGVPSLAAEPSYFGSLAILMAMYLLHRGKRSDAIFVAIAVVSVLMSGSVLAVLLLGFPFLYLRTPVKLLAAGATTLLVFADAAFNQAGLTARLGGFHSAGEGLVGILVDPSLNLRFGQIWFTLWENVVRELAFASAVSFGDQYNAFGAATGFLIPTESDFILPMAGELIYDSGVIGLAIVVLLMRHAWAGGTSTGEKLIRLAFVAACLVNPVSVANPFLVFFVLQRPVPGERKVR